MEKILETKNLEISFRTYNGMVRAVRNVSFDLYKGETLAIVGESGSGKSVTSRAILGILANNKVVDGGEILYKGYDLLKLSENDFHKIRGSEIAMIFQDPLSSLNPIMKIGKQITETIYLKNKVDRKQAKLRIKQVVSSLKEQCLKDDKITLNEIVKLIQDYKEDMFIQDEAKMEILLDLVNRNYQITNSVKEKINSEIDLLISKLNNIIEHETISLKQKEIFDDLKTFSLKEEINQKIFKSKINSLEKSFKEALVNVFKISHIFDSLVQYLTGDLVSKIENLKSEVTKLEFLLRLNQDLKTLAKKFKSGINYLSLADEERMESLISNLVVQNKEYLNDRHYDKMISQNILTLNELKSFVLKYIITDISKNQVNEIIEYLHNQQLLKKSRISRKNAKRKAIDLMRLVGIPEPEKRFNQFSFQFSGGMRQRIVIAIALASDPKILICDEPTTALDVTIQAQILDMINELKVKKELSIIFITHDLGVVAHMADRIAVMYAGKIVEYGSADDIFYDPRHPYTWALLSSMPDLNTKEKLEPIPGTPPNMLFPPKGDAFAVRNRYALEIDYEMEPPLFKINDTHFAATWLLHPKAPKVLPPKIVTERIKEAKRRDMNV